MSVRIVGGHGNSVGSADLGDRSCSSYPLRRDGLKLKATSSRAHMEAKVFSSIANIEVAPARQRGGKPQFDLLLELAGEGGKDRDEYTFWAFQLQVGQVTSRIKHNLEPF